MVIQKEWPDGLAVGQICYVFGLIVNISLRIRRRLIVALSEWKLKVSWMR